MPGATPFPSGTSTIRGRVTTTGDEPLDAVQISIGTRSAQTNADGRYEVTGLAGGSYPVQASKESFVPWRYRQTALDEREPAMVTVGDDQAVDDIDIVLPKAAVVSGRVVEPGGRIVANARVMPVVSVFQNGRRRLRPVWTRMVRHDVTTNDRGEFVLSELPPGDYFVLALPPAGPSAAALDPRQPGLAPALYPAAASLTAAAPLRVDFGDVRNGLDITLSTAARFEIRGVVFDRSGRPAREGRVQALRRGYLPSMDFEYGLAGEAAVQADGSYVLRGLRPERYGLRALLQTAEADRVEQRIADRLESTAWSVVDVGQQDVDRVRLSASRLATVRGRVSFDDASAAQSIAPSDVCARPNAWDLDDAWFGVGERISTPGPDSAGRLSPGYTFEWRLLPGRLALSAGLCSDGPFATTPSWQVKRIVAGGRVVTDEGVDVGTDGLDDIEIVLTIGPRLTGVVRDAQGTPRANRPVIVFSRDSTRWARLRNRYFAIGFTDPQGRYQAAAPPGEYYAAAVERGTIETWSDPEFLEKLAAAAVRVSLTEREASQVDLVVR